MAALPWTALADPKVDDAIETCASAAERGQKARGAGKLLQARAEFHACIVPMCPQVVQHDCQRWLTEVDQEVPSVVFRARDARNLDVVGVRVYANGVLLVRELDGKPIVLDPGHYDLRYETSSGAVQTNTVLLRQGERFRELSIRFGEALESDGALARPRTAPRASSVRQPPSPRHPRSHAQPSRTPSNTWGYLFGAGGIATLGAFAFFELRGQARYRDLQDGCGRTQSCSENQVDAARTDFIAAGSFLAASAVLLGLSTWQFLSTQQQSTSGHFSPHRVPGRFAF